MSIPTQGAWCSLTDTPLFRQEPLLNAVQRIREPIHVVRDEHGTVGVAFSGQTLPDHLVNGTPSWPLLASLPPLYPEWLGDRSFCEVHGVRFPYVQGAMANGIATTRLVIAMARAGFLGFFGAAGLNPARVEEAVDELVRDLGHGVSWGCNLIHSPNEPDVEQAVVDLYLRKGVKRISAAAYMALTPMVVQFAAAGLRKGANGRIERDTHVFAKISRPEVARRFMSPAPAEMLDALVASGKITREQGELARRVPVAEDYIVESDSGGHTDNQPLGALFPMIHALRDELMARYDFTRPIRLGAAGGIGTPQAAASAYALGAAFILTGSVNQGAIESGLSDEGKKMLAQADLADVVMAPAADMFELGVEVQVLKRGTMFGVRAKKLYDLYKAHPSMDAIPAKEKASLEKSILKRSCDEVWADTRSFFLERDPREVERAERDEKHKMALCFRWYLGLSSKWAIWGQDDRRMDYQIWCGPAMGAFNQWAKGSFLEKPEARQAVQIALNLVEGAACVTRAQQLRSYGVPVPAAAFQFRPRPLS